MDNKLFKSFGILFILVTLYFLNKNIQSKYTPLNNQFFSIEEKDINKIIISSKEDIIELSRSDTIWSISGNDTLIIKKNLVKNLFESMNELQKLHLVTSKKSNWARYGISDTLGTHLALIDGNGLTKFHYVFGLSNDEYNKCYVRSNKNSDVHLLNSNILYQLQTSPLFWGTKSNQDNELN